MNTNTFPVNLLKTLVGDVEDLGVSEEKLTSEEAKAKFEQVLDDIKGEGFKESLLKEMYQNNKTKEKIMEEYKITEGAFDTEVASELRKLRHPAKLRFINSL